MIAIPAFFYDQTRTERSASVISERTQDYIISKKLLLSASEAIERIMLAIKDVNELAGYTFRVADMLQVFKEVSNEKYVRPVVQSEKKKPIDISVRNFHENSERKFFFFFSPVFKSKRNCRRRNLY
jgi:hypothetical protein